MNVSDENQIQTHMPWLDGLPTKPDVDALIKAFPPETIRPGEWRVADTDVRAHIGRADGQRYHTVYSAWRRRLRNDHAVIIFREKDSGFYCPTADQAFSNTHSTLEGVGRKIGRQLRVVSIVRPTNELERSVQEHQGRLLHAVKRDIRAARMNALPSAPAVQEAPRLGPPPSKVGGGQEAQ